MRSIIPALFALALAAPAQETIGPPQRGRRPFDRVVAIIGDRVVLESTLAREIEARSNGRITPSERNQLALEVLTELKREEIWIQHGKSIGDQASGRFAESIEKAVDDQLADEIRSSGSFTRLDEELGQLGSSWNDVRRRQRNQILEQIALGSVMTQLHHNQGLMVTPAEMRRYFDDHPEQFNRPASSDVAWVSFEARDEESAKRAEQAAAAWRKSNRSSTEIAKDFGGVDLGTLENIRQTEKDRRIPMLKKFAAAHALGDVAVVRRDEHTLAVLRMEDKIEAASSSFADPFVQSRIRQRLANIHAAEWQNRVLLRKRRKIYVWPPALGAQ